MNVGEFVSHNKVPLAIGAGGIVLFLVLRGRTGPSVAAQAPVEGVPTPMAAPPAAAQDYGSTGRQASAIQDQLAQQAANQQAAAGNLALLGAQQQLQFQGAQNQQELALGAEQLHQQQEVTYGLYKSNRPKSPGGVIGAFSRFTGLTPQVAEQYTQAAAQGYALYSGISTGAPVRGVPAQPTPLLGGAYPTAGQVYGGS